MWNYEKRLQFPVKIARPNPAIANIVISQFGGPDGELAASMRYLSQRYAMPYREVKGLLTDIGTEEQVPSLYTLRRPSGRRGKMVISKSRGSVPLYRPSFTLV